MTNSCAVQIVCLISAEYEIVQLTQITVGLATIISDGQAYQFAPYEVSSARLA